MKLKFLLLNLVLAASILHSQDTVSVFFEFGKSSIPDDQFKTLNLIPSQYDMNDLVSVKYIGVADSVGKLSDNIKLSEKRALAIKRYCSAFILKGVRTEVTALGEKVGKDAGFNRRVDIVFYFKPNKPEPMQWPGVEPPPGCYYVDHYVLHRCVKQIVSRKKKKYVVLEAAELTLERSNQDFYASTDKDGKVSIHKVKWIARQTGKDWWRGTRYIAEIPKADFDKFKIFRIEDKPCDNCQENIVETKELSNEDDCQQVDRFLMRNLQVKIRFFDRSRVKVRVPREFVDLDDKYYVGCDYKTPLIWKSKNGRKHKKYYYTELPVRRFFLQNIVRVMKCCKNNPEPSECDKPLIGIMDCWRTLDRSLFFTFELGHHFQFFENIAYAAFGLSKYGRLGQTLFNVGLNSKTDIHASLRLECMLFAIPFKALNPVSSWQSPGSAFQNNWWLTLNAGSEIKSRYSTTAPLLLDANLHVGLSALNAKPSPFISRVFVNYGVGYDLAGNHSATVYPILHSGINVNIAKIASAAIGGPAGGLD